MKIFFVVDERTDNGGGRRIKRTFAQAGQRLEHQWDETGPFGDGERPKVVEETIAKISSEEFFSEVLPPHPPHPNPQIPTHKSQPTNSNPQIPNPKPHPPNPRPMTSRFALP